MSMNRVEQYNGGEYNSKFIRVMICEHPDNNVKNTITIIIIIIPVVVEPVDSTGQ